MSPPPFTLPLAVATPAAAELFERAFHPDGRLGRRPAPEDWVEVLDSLKASLADCASVPWHQYPSRVRSCPWCEIERASGAKLYGGLVRAACAPIADLKAIWARYLKIADPGATRPLPKEEDWTPPAGKGRMSRRLRRVIALTMAVASLGVADAIATVSLVAALAPVATGGLLVVLLTRWPKGTPETGAAAQAAFVEAEKARDAELFNIGAARLAVLRSWGIESAAEIHQEKIGDIPGFGRNLTERLINWRQGLDRKFHFEVAVVTDPLKVQRIDRELAARRTQATLDSHKTFGIATGYRI
jgi:DNA-binding helix-hairpin-helix protein with protein kinase domain